MPKKIDVSDLAMAIADELGVYEWQAQEAIKKAIDKTADAVVEELKATSPKRTGKYAGSWSNDASERPKAHKYSKTVYASAPYYRLTHLLEKGHATVNGGRTAPITHIAPAATDAETLLVKHIREELE